MKLYCVDTIDGQTWHDESLPLEERARRYGFYEDWIVNRVAPFIHADCGGEQEIIVTGPSFGAYHAANVALKRADLFPLAICQSGVCDISVVGWGERGDAVYFNNAVDYTAHFHGDHLDWLRGRLSMLVVCGQGQWEDTTGALESSKRFAAVLGGKKGLRHELDLWGHDAPADRLAVLARADRAPPAAVLLTWASTPGTAGSSALGARPARARRSRRAAATERAPDRRARSRAGRARAGRGLRPRIRNALARHARMAGHRSRLRRDGPGVRPRDGRGDGARRRRARCVGGGRLATWTPPRDAYDLVVCLYVHVAGSVGELVRRMAQGVAAAGPCSWSATARSTRPRELETAAAGQVQVSVAAALAALDPGEWEPTRRPKSARGRWQAPAWTR